MKGRVESTPQTTADGVRIDPSGGRPHIRFKDMFFEGHILSRVLYTIYIYINTKSDRLRLPLVFTALVPQYYLYKTSPVDHSPLLLSVRCVLRLCYIHRIWIFSVESQS